MRSIASSPLTHQELHQHLYYPDLQLYIPLSPPDTFDDPYQHHAEKRLKLEQPAINFFPDASSPLELGFNSNMHQGQLYRLNAPHINLQTASESASPVTVATTLSQHSTPSRSPSRVSIISDSAPDWVLYDECTLGHDRKDRVLLNNQPLSSYPIHMEPALQNGYYGGYPTDFPKVSYLTPYSSSYQTLPHNTEDDPPALSPSNRYSPSGQPSIHDGDLRSPMTPISSPGSHDGGRASNKRTSTTHIHNPVPRDQAAMEMKVQQPRQRPNKIVTSTAPNPTLSTFYQRAQKDHAMEARHTTPNQLSVSGSESPFRAHSPFHPMRAPQQATQTAPTRHSNFLPYMTLQSRREHQKGLEAQSINEHMMAEAEQVVSTPKTISPKDSVLEYPENDSRISLFAHEQSYGNGHQLHTPSTYNARGMADMSDRGYNDLISSRRGSEAESLPSVGAFSYNSSPQIPMLASNFPFHSQPLDSSAMVSMMGDNQHAKTASPIMKPEGAKADTGAYSCTAPGCQLRFTTILKLQKHRRENHHQFTPSDSAGMTSTLHGTSRHQGPHRCTRVNPTTGKPCNTIFSRPYDLTRHEDTIHNTTREKVRCEICNDEKTFSRQDALTRHKKVKHGIDK
jgi:hypothetical protein